MKKMTVPVLALVLLSGSALASGRVHMPLVSHTVQRTADGITRDTVSTDAHGRTSTREMTNDRVDGVHEREVTYVGKDGVAHSLDNVRSANGHSKETSFTHKNGEVVTKDVSVTRDPTTHVKTVERERTVVRSDAAG